MDRIGETSWETDHHDVLARIHDESLGEKIRQGDGLDENTACERLVEGDDGNVYRRLWECRVDVPTGRGFDVQGYLTIDVLGKVIRIRVDPYSQRVRLHAFTSSITTCRFVTKYTTSFLT